MTAVSPRADSPASPEPHTRRQCYTASRAKAARHAHLRTRALQVLLLMGTVVVLLTAVLGRKG